MEEGEEVEEEEVEEHHPVMSVELEPAVSTSEAEEVVVEGRGIGREVEGVSLWNLALRRRRQSRRPNQLLLKMLHLFLLE